MVAAESFDRDNLTRAKILDRVSNGSLVAVRNLVASYIKIMRSARRARDGLRMKAPIHRIYVFGGAMSIERPSGHRGVGAIVWQTANDAVARPAVRAINIGIMMAAIVGVEEFLQALFANRQGGGNSHAALSRITNSVTPTGSADATSTSEICAACGGCDFISCRNDWSASPFPSRWVSTPSSPFKT